ncbi:MAG: hypothetical protein ACKVOM_12950 [Ferruginibacter sp.]
MNTRENILNELKEISSLVATVPFINVFTVDGDYFSALQPVVMARINAEKIDTFQQNFTVPDGYFENLSENILKRIRAGENEAALELANISPLIAGIFNKETYTAPIGYFDGLTFISEPKVQPAKIVRMSLVRSVFKFAAAAVIIGLLGISIINITDNNTNSPQEIIAGQTASVLKDANAIIKAGSFDETLQAVSDEEIKKYLQQNGQDVNAALVASSTDDADKLPEAADYLLDENVLENYLKENNLKN